MKLTVIKDDKTIDATKYTGNYNRSDNIDALGMDLSFDLAHNPDDRYWPTVLPEPGDKVTFTNNDKQVFQGIIVDESWNGKRQRSYTAYDYGFYLNKNEVIAQFNGMTGDAAIKKLCNQFAIPVGSVASISTMIKKIYNGQVLSDCIKDIMAQATAETGKKYRMEVRENKLYIELYSDLMIRAMYQPAENIAPFEVTLVPADISGSRSMADMRNIIKIVSGSEKDAHTVAETKDDAGISKFGMLQKVEKADDKDIAQARNIAKNKLVELNKITKSQSVLLLGDDAVRSGRILEFNQPNLGLVGQYLVKNCRHSYNNNNHTMQLDLEAV